MDTYNIKQVNQLTITAYMNVAERYHEDFRNELEGQEFDRYLLDQISDSIDDNSRVLDAGCGPSAQVACYLQEKGHRAVAADLCPRCVEMVSDNTTDIECIVTDMRNSCLEENSFDAIIAKHSLIHTPRSHTNKFFREFSDLLRPGGRLLIVVKKGKEEGIITGDWWEDQQIYFTHFMEFELEAYAREYSFSIDLLETRKPYESEISVDRIYLLCTKIDIDIAS